MPCGPRGGDRSRPARREVGLQGHPDDDGARDAGHLGQQPGRRRDVLKHMGGDGQVVLPLACRDALSVKGAGFVDLRPRGGEVDGATDDPKSDAALPDAATSELAQHGAVAAADLQDRLWSPVTEQPFDVLSLPMAPSARQRPPRSPSRAL